MWFARNRNQSKIKKQVSESMILRDFLALERTKLANERTFFAYIRTSLYLVLGAIAFLQIEDLGNIQWLGYVCFALSAVLFTIGIIRYYKLKEKLKNKYYLKAQSEKNEAADKE
jgi:putative membrane protein